MNAGSRAAKALAGTLVVAAAANCGLGAATLLSAGQQLNGCRTADLAECRFPPFDNLGASACDQLRRHLAGRTLDEQIVKGVQRCDAPIASMPSRWGAAAAVAARLEVDGPPSHAAFLFLNTGSGWRLVDQLLAVAWTHGGDCRTRFKLLWAAGGGGRDEGRLMTASERICTMPLDRAEAAAGESDVASTECRRARYVVRAAHPSRIAAADSDLACGFK